MYTYKTSRTSLKSKWYKILTNHKNTFTCVLLSKKKVLCFVPFIKMSKIKNEIKVK